MARRSLPLAAATLLAGSVLVVSAPTSASPPQPGYPTVFGQPCTANTLTAPNTQLVLYSSYYVDMPWTAPSDGVVTEVLIRDAHALGATTQQRIRIIRPTSVASQFTTVAQSDLLTVVDGSDARLPVRLPLQTGDYLGLYGSQGTLECFDIHDDGSSVRTLVGDPAPGTTATYGAQQFRAIPVVATIEPDADHDGYGDLTQDQCPTSALTQQPCPPLTLTSFAYADGKAITVLVAADAQTTASVAGTAKVAGKMVALGGVGRAVTPGAFTQFSLKLPPALRSALADLPRSRSIKVGLTVLASNVAGVPVVDTVTVKVPGQAHKHPHHRTHS